MRVQVQMSRAELGRLRSCKGANRKLLSRLNIVKRVRRSFPPCFQPVIPNCCQPGIADEGLHFSIDQDVQVTVH